MPFISSNVNDQAFSYNLGRATFVVKLWPDFPSSKILCIGYFANSLHGKEKISNKGYSLNSNSVIMILFESLLSKYEDKLVNCLNSFFFNNLLFFSSEL